MGGQEAERPEDRGTVVVGDEVDDAPVLVEGGHVHPGALHGSARGRQPGELAEVRHRRSPLTRREAISVGCPDQLEVKIWEAAMHPGGMVANRIASGRHLASPEILVDGIVREEGGDPLRIAFVPCTEVGAHQLLPLLHGHMVTAL